MGVTAFTTHQPFICILMPSQPPGNCRTAAARHAASLQPPPPCPESVARCSCSRIGGLCLFELQPQTREREWQHASAAGCCGKVAWLVCRSKAAPGAAARPPLQMAPWRLQNRWIDLYSTRGGKITRGSAVSRPTGAASAQCRVQTSQKPSAKSHVRSQPCRNKLQYQARVPQAQWLLAAAAAAALPQLPPPGWSSC